MTETQIHTPPETPPARPRGRAAPFAFAPLMLVGLQSRRVGETAAAAMVLAARVSGCLGGPETNASGCWPVCMHGE